MCCEIHREMHCEIHAVERMTRWGCQIRNRVRTRVMHACAYHAGERMTRCGTCCTDFSATPWRTARTSRSSKSFSCGMLAAACPLRGLAATPSRSRRCSSRRRSRRRSRSSPVASPSEISSSRSRSSSRWTCISASSRWPGSSHLMRETIRRNQTQSDAISSRWPGSSHRFGAKSRACLSPSGQLSSLLSGCRTCQIRVRGRLRVVCMHGEGRCQRQRRGAKLGRVHARCPLRQ